MDPEACLRAADQAISDLDSETAISHLSDYWAWRRRGGFEPIEVAGTLMSGDRFARWCTDRLKDRNT